jgi:hypothetical protein
MDAVCNNSRVCTADIPRIGGSDRVRRSGLLAALLAVLILTATGTTTTTTSPSTAAVAMTTAVTVDRATLHEAGPYSTDGSHDIRGDGSGSTVRVMKKVRGILIPHGLIPPPLVPTDVATPQRVGVTHRWMPATTSPARGQPWRGPPVLDAHPPS